MNTLSSLTAVKLFVSACIYDIISNAFILLLRTLTLSKLKYFDLKPNCKSHAKIDSWYFELC
jgi:hypothetical protein